MYKMYKFYLVEVSWRPFNPHGYHQTMIFGKNICIFIKYNIDYFEDNLSK